MRLLAIIPARGGSKGVPRKNIKDLGGKPLIAWSIEAARGVKKISKLIVSTDDEDIASIARGLDVDVPFLRPRELALDGTAGVAPILHAIELFPEFSWVLVLQPTSPFRSAVDIENIINLCLESDSPSAVSLCEATSHPYWTYKLSESNGLSPFMPEGSGIACRQDLPAAYMVNGALYLAQCDWLRQQKGFIGPETLGYVMPLNRSIDLDTQSDWERAEFLMKNEYGKK